MYSKYISLNFASRRCEDKKKENVFAEKRRDETRTKEKENGGGKRFDVKKRERGREKRGIVVPLHRSRVSYESEISSSLGAFLYSFLQQDLGYQTFARRQFHSVCRALQRIGKEKAESRNYRIFSANNANDLRGNLL